MKILFVAHTYPRWSGDRAGAQVHRFALEAMARGHQVRVVAPHAAGAAEGRDVLEGVEVHRFRYVSDRGERIGYQGAVAKSLGVAALAVLPSYLLRFRAAVVAQEREFHPDVISVHWWAPGALATGGARTPVAVTCHGSDVRLLGASAVIRLVGRRILRRAAGVSAVSRVMVDDLRNWGGRGEVALTPMPIDDARFTTGGIRRRPPVVLYAGNLIRAKGVDLILRAVAELRRAGVAFVLRLVGDGPERAAFEALASELGIGGDVEWAGPQGHERMPAEYAAASVYVLASRGPRGEGMPLTVVEALLSECGVVATPAGGVPELVRDGVTGLIARDGDAAHLAAQLGRMLGDESLRLRLGAEGRRAALASHGKGPAMDRFFGFLETVARGARR